MMQIFKYDIQPGGNELKMPRGAKLLCVQMQGDHIKLWALVHPGDEMATRHIVVRSTGVPIDTPLAGEYIGTIQYQWYVGHAFDLGEAA